MVSLADSKLGKKIGIKPGISLGGGTRVGVPGTSGAISYGGGGGGGGGGGSSGSTITQENFQAQLEAQRKADAEAKATADAAEKARQEQLSKQTQQYLRDLSNREALRQTAKERGYGFSRIEAQRFLRERGTTLGGLREATRASRDTYKKTGISITQQIRDKADQERQLKIDRTNTQLNLKINQYR